MNSADLLLAFSEELCMDICGDTYTRAGTALLQLFNAFARKEFPDTTSHCGVVDRKLLAAFSGSTHIGVSAESSRYNALFVQVRFEEFLRDLLAGVAGITRVEVGTSHYHTYVLEQNIRSFITIVHQHLASHIDFDSSVICDHPLFSSDSVIVYAIGMLRYMYTNEASLSDLSDGVYLDQLDSYPVDSLDDVLSDAYITKTLFSCDEAPYDSETDIDVDDATTVCVTRQEMRPMLLSDLVWLLVEDEYDELFECILELACLSKPKHYSVLGSALLELFRLFLEHNPTEPSAIHALLTGACGTEKSDNLELRFKSYLLTQCTRLASYQDSSMIPVDTKLFYMFVAEQGINRALLHVHKRIMCGETGTLPHKLFSGYSAPLALVMLRYMYSNGGHA